MPIIRYMCNQIRGCLKNRTLLSNKKNRLLIDAIAWMNFKNILKKEPDASYMTPFIRNGTKGNRIAMQSRLGLDKVGLEKFMLDGRRQHWRVTRELLRVMEMFCHPCGHDHKAVHVLQNH